MNERPTGITANKKTKEFTVTWDDGHTSVYPFELLRAACPCASCRGGHENMRSEPDADGGMAPAFAAEQRDLGVTRPAIPGVPKSTVLGPYFRWTSVSGLIDPFFLEVVLTTDALPFERPALLAHEWGHLAGFAHEAEAGFVGWVTAMRAGEQGRCSAWLDLYPRLAEALPADVRARLDQTLQGGPRSDYRAIAPRLAQASPRARDAA